MTKEFVIEVEGMTCNHCVKRVKTAVEGLPATIAEVDLESGKVKVKTNNPGVNEEEVKKIINETDIYQAK